MLKRNFFLGFTTILLLAVLAFTSCENGVSFDPTEHIADHTENGETGTPIVFTAAVVNKGTNYTFTGSDGNYDIRYFDFTEESAKEAKTVSIELTLGDLHSSLPITVEYIPSEETSFIGNPKFNDLDFTAVGVTSDNPILIVNIPLSPSDLEQTGTFTLKFSDESGHAYDTENSPKEIKIAIARKFEDEIGDPIKFTAAVANNGDDYLFKVEDKQIIYTDRSDSSALETKTVSIKLTLKDLHAIYPITVDSVVVNGTDTPNFIGTPVLSRTELNAAANTLTVDIPLALSEIEQAGTFTLKFSDKNGIIYDTANSPVEIPITIKRIKDTGPIEPNTIEFTTKVTNSGEDYTFTDEAEGAEYTIKYIDGEGAVDVEASIKLELGNLIEGYPVNVNYTVDNTGSLGFITAPAPATITNSDNKLTVTIPLKSSSTNNQKGTITLSFSDSFSDSNSVYLSESLEKTIKINIERYKYTPPADFTLVFPTNGLPPNIDIDNSKLTESPASVSITDNTGKGVGGMSFDLITFPLEIENIPEGDRGVEVTIGNVPGSAEFFDLHFCSDEGACNCDKLKTFIFKPGESNRKLRIKLSKTTSILKGSLPITFEYDEKVYKNTMPKQLTLNFESEGTVDCTLYDYVDTFTVSTADVANKDGDKYFTKVTIPGIPNLTGNLIYKIERKDDSSPEFKEIDKRTIPATVSFEYKDYDAFILRNPIQKYKITVEHEKCTNDGCNTEVNGVEGVNGSRMLTNRELFLAAMDSMRYALIDSERTVKSGDHADRGVQDIFRNYIGGKWKYATASDNEGGSFEHKMGYWGWYMTHEHLYTMASYKPYFMKLDGSFTYKSDKAIVKSINTIYDNGVEDKAPFTGTVNFTSPYGNGSIIFNSININNDTWSNPGWANGNFTLKMDGEDPITYGKDDVPFGFYMTNGEFLGKLLDNGNYYTQQ